MAKAARCRPRKAIAALALMLALMSAVSVARAQTADTEQTQAHFQSTWIWQNKPAFSAAYSGEHSLARAQERTYSLTATAFLGARAWQGAEFYLNPEVAMGVPLSNLTGLGGFQNGELARTSGPHPTLYLARAFVRQTIDLGGEKKFFESDINRLGSEVDRRRLVLTVGQLSVTDLFDNNAYSHDARKQFLNWALVTHGAYDFAADARGYSRGIALEWYHDDWAIRAGRFAMPTIPNGTTLNDALATSYGDQIELERGYTVAGAPGRVRVLLYRNRAVMGTYGDALALAAKVGGAPDLAPVRSDQTKTGHGISLEQSLGSLGGAFARYSRADGQHEVYAYAEIDQSVSGGVLIEGANWSRPLDLFGLAAAVNSLSGSHSQFLGQGGLGFFVGDGRINYRPEQIVECFYAWSLAPKVQLSLNAQWFRQPAYNLDRGPAYVYGLRLHAEF
jgi:hypothetical protein